MIVVWVCFGFTLVSFALAAAVARRIAAHGDEDTLIGHEVEKQHERRSDDHQHGHAVDASDRAISTEKPSTVGQHADTVNHHQSV